MTAALGYKLVAGLHPWVLGDWLINYEGGFVRRGLTGQLIFLVDQHTSLTLPVVTLLLQLAAYLVFYAFSYLLLARDSRPFLYLLLVLSPFLFSFQVMAYPGGFRKEILYFALLAVSCWSQLYGAPGKKTGVMIATYLVYPALIASHEMLAVFLPVLLVVHGRQLHWCLDNGNYRALCLVGLGVILSVLVFLLAITRKVDAETASAICRSLGAYCTQGGSLDWLGRDLSFGMRRVRDNVFSAAHLLQLGAAVALALLAFLPLRGRLLALLDLRLNCLMLLVSMAGTVAVMAVAVDWGRLFYIWCVTLFLLSFLPGDAGERSAGAGTLAISKTLLGLLLCYLLAWKIPYFPGAGVVGRLPILIHSHIPL